MTVVRNPQHTPRYSNFVVGAIVLSILCVATYLGFTKSVPFRHHYTVKAVFKSANNVRPNSFVRIAGIKVGKVTKVERVHPGEQAAVVSMQFDDNGLPLHKDAVMTIRPRIFLEGNFFVDVQPGSPSAPKIDDGDTIPIQQTKSPVQLDQILTALQTDTREELKVLLAELSEGLAGEGGKGFNRSIPYWEPAYKNSAIVNDATLGTELHDLSGYVKGSGAVAESLTKNSEQLKSLITDLNTTAQALAVNNEDLADAIAELPETLKAGQPALQKLNDSFPALRRFVADFRPAVRSSGPALDANTPFAAQLNKLVSKPELRGLVRDLAPTVPALARLNVASTPLQEQVRSAASCQNEVILPWTLDKIDDATFPATGKVYEEATKPLGGLAGESRSGDANGQWFRVLLSAGNYAYPLGTEGFFLTNAPILGVNPPKPQKQPQFRPDVPCETQQAPDLRTVPAPAPVGHRARIPANRQKDYLKIQNRTIKWLRRELKRDGLSKRFKVSSTPITRADLKTLKAVADRAKRVNRP